MPKRQGWRPTQPSRPRRRRAVKLLAVAGDVSSDAVLLSLASPEQPPELAVAAARALAAAAPRGRRPQAVRGRAVGRAIRPRCGARSSRRSSAGRSLRRRWWTRSESGAVPAASLSEPQRKWLSEAGDDNLKARTAKLLAAGGRPRIGKKAFEDSKAVLSLKPDPVKGQRAFMAHCSSCHRLDREGYAVGPDLYGIRSQPKESILLHIVVPEQEVAPNFAAYDCVTTDGRTITGIMTAETPSSVTLRQVLGLEETLPREQIKSLTISKSSLMPQGLEKAMKPQELADLLAYLRGEK